MVFKKGRSLIKIMNGTEPKVLLSRLDTHFWQNLEMVVQSLASEL